MYDIRDNKQYVVRKLADSRCWMTENLELQLSTGAPSVGSKNDGTTFTWTPVSCGANGTCAMNGNTLSYSGNWYYSWYAATAGIGTLSSTGDTDGSICPAGWRMPTGDIYSNMVDSVYYSGSGWYFLESFPFSIQLLDIVRSSTRLNPTGYSYYHAGYYWTATACGSSSICSTSTNNGARELHYYQPGTDGSPTTIGGWNQKSDGNTVRCVAL